MEGFRSAAIAVVVSLENRAVSSRADDETARTALPDDGDVNTRGALGEPGVPAGPPPDLAARWFASHAGSGFRGGAAVAPGAPDAPADAPLPFAAAGASASGRLSEMTCQSSSSSSVGGHTSEGAVLSVDASMLPVVLTATGSVAVRGVSPLDSGEAAAGAAPSALAEAPFDAPADVSAGTLAALMVEVDLAGGGTRWMSRVPGPDGPSGAENKHFCMTSFC